MNRRAFFRLIAVAIFGWALPKLNPKLKPKPADVGVTTRVVRRYDPESGRFVTRVDVMYGFASMYPEYACVVVG